MATDALVVLSTFANADDAANAARTLVRGNLAACVSLTEVRSIYRWKDDDLADNAECLAISKTTAARLPALRAALLEIHPYEVPEIIALPVSDGHEPYLAWLAQNTRG
ncbi:MAG TPA: divalent-cation tolerance protein CutA [Kofleriaceae bacterium]|nr:divalent-cation tolerance protein CutA [Kofleriaceae bacterium]